MCTVASCGVSMMWCLCFYCGVSHVSSIHLSPSPKMDIVLVLTCIYHGRNCFCATLLGWASRRQQDRWPCWHSVRCIGGLIYGLANPLMIEIGGEYTLEWRHWNTFSDASWLAYAAQSMHWESVSTTAEKSTAQVHSGVWSIHIGIWL